MLWLLVLGLLVWATFLTFRVSDLKERTQGLERRLLDLKAAFEEGAVAAPRTKPAPRPEPAAAEHFLPPKPFVVSPTLTAEVESPEPFVASPPEPREPAGPPPREVIRAWLEENGLAWAGGGALALGGLFLVTYAAQRGMFTPPFRIAAAVVTGLVLLAASEWLKRRSDHPLAAAMAAGAGAATLYGAAWASYWLYAFIGLAPAGGLMAAISLGLLALAFRHGEPLAILAILGGFLAPAITGPDQWSAPALTGYLALITVTGYAVAGVRRWGRAGMATLVGAFGWAFAGYAAQGYVRVAALALAPLALSAAAVEWRRRKGEPPIVGGPTDVFNLMPTAALAAGGAGLFILWVVAAQGAFHPAAAGAAFIAVMAAFAARRGLIPPILQVVGYLPALGFQLSFMGPVMDPAAREVWGGVLVLALMAAGLGAGTVRGDLHARFGAAAAGLVALVLALTLSGPLTAAAPWVPAAVGGLLLLAGAVVLARSSDDAQRDLPLAIWIWAAGAAAIFAVDRAFNDIAAPVAAAVLALGAAALHARLGWRGFAAVMTAAALASMAALMSPALFLSIREGELPWWALALAAAASTALAWAGARLADRPDRPKESAEALSTAALLVGLAGAGVLLRLAASPSPAEGGGLDLFLEASLRTVLILAAGLTSAQAVRADSSLIGRWRGQVLLILGLLHGVGFQLAAFNPLWAWWKPAVAGPPLLDSLAVGFLVPAALLAAATWKKVAINRTLLAAYGLGAFGFGLFWALFETRRLFQGASLHGGFDVVGRAEAAAYAVIALIVARGVIWLGERAAERLWTVSAFDDQIVRIGRLGAWAALVLALVVFGYGASPWWGPIDRPLAGMRATALLFALYAAGGGVTFLVAQSAARAEVVLLARAARLLVVGIVFALLNLIVRLVFRGYDMRPNLTEASLETWAFSAMWGLYGFGLLIYGAARRSNDLRGAGLAVLMITLAKIFLFDMSRLDGIIRAGSFLAVGALLLAAAVIVRRVGGGFGRDRKPAAEAPEP
jgi:uncharacterized membrane protein